jgi:hypothetical protein
MPSSLHLVGRICSAVGIALAASSLPGASNAQLAPASIDSVMRRDPCAPSATAAKAHYIIAPYGWMAGINAETGVRDLSADVDISFSDLLSKLRFAAMGTFEFGYGHWLGIADGVYTSIHQDRTASVGRLTPDIDFNQKLFIGQAFGGYSFRARSNVAIDVLAGVRLWRADVSLRLSGEDIARQRERARTWADALGGVRVRWEPAARWYVSAAGDGGGGGSEGTGEGMGTVGYDVSHHWNVFAAYRYLYEDYRKYEFFFTGHFSGPAIGGAYRW